MDFSRVEAALGKIGLLNEYIEEFKENGLHDGTINFEDEGIVSVLSEIIPCHPNRAKFRKAFKALPVASSNNTKNETPGVHSVNTPIATSSQSSGPDQERLQVTQSQDSGQPSLQHAEYVNYKALDLKGESKFRDVDIKMQLNIGSVRKLEVPMGENFGNPSKKMKIEVKNMEFNILDPIPSFTGREEFLEYLHKKIQDGKEKGEHLTILSQTSVISGMGGVGKTQTLRKYILKYKKQYDHIIWIHSESESTMSTEFFDLADNKLGISCKNDEGQRDSDEVIKESVYDNLCEKRCLIVFDNAESYDQECGIQKFLPSTIKGTWKTPTIIVTSRIRDWEPHVAKERVIQLGGLTEAEIWQFFSKCLELHDTDENRGLSKKIGDLCEGLPLVLQQVWGLIVTEHEKRNIIGKGSYTMKDFLSEYEEGKKKYLTNKPLDSVLPESVYRIFSITFHKLLERENGVLALRFLRMMSFLSPSCIPKKLFSSLIQESEKNAYPDTLVMLKKYNLINVYDTSFEIHRTNQEVTIEHMKAPISSSTNNLEADAGDVESGSNFTIINEILGQIMKGLDKYLPNISPNDPLKHASFQNAFCVAFHSKHMFTLDGVPRFADNLINGAENIYYTETYALLCTIRTQCSAEMYKNASATSSKPRQLLLTIKYKQACVLKKMSKFDEALRLYAEIISALEDEHESDLLFCAKNQMAMTLLALGRYEEAQGILQHLINEKEGTEDTEGLRSLKKDLAHVLMERSRYEEAIVILKPLVQELEAAGCAWEACNLTLQHNLAFALMRLDQHNEALQLLQKVVLCSEQLVGRTHPATLTRKLTLVSLLLTMTKFQEALTLCQEVTKEAVDVVNEDNVLMLTLKGNMALALEQLGRYEEALAISEDVSMKWKRHGENHPQHLVHEEIIALLEHKLGRHQRALSRLEYVVDSCSRTLGPDHDLTMSSTSDKAVVLTHLGRLSDAEETLRKLLETQKKVFGLTHSTTLAAKTNLSRVLHAQGKFKEALAMANEVVIAYEDVFGSDHLDTIAAKTNRAVTLGALGNHQEAQETYQTILHKISETSGSSKTHPVVLAVRQNLAASLHDTGKIEEAISLLEAIIHDCSEVGEVDPKFIILALIDLGVIMERTERYNEARNHFEEAASRAESVFGAFDPRSIEAKISLADVTRLLGNFQGSVALHRQAIEACESCYGPHDKKTEDAKLHLAATLVENSNTISGIEEGLIIFEKKLAKGKEGLQSGNYWTLKMKVDMLCDLVKSGREKLAKGLMKNIHNYRFKEMMKSGRQKVIDPRKTLEFCEAAQFRRVRVLIQEWDCTFLE